MQSGGHTRHANAVVCCYLQASLRKSHYPHGADMQTLNWRPATQQPETDAPITAILAARDEDGWCITSKYIWRANIGWRHERKSTPPLTGDYVWIPETELLATIAK